MNCIDYILTHLQRLQHYIKQGNHHEWNRPYAFMYVQDILLCHNSFLNVTSDVGQQQVKKFIGYCKQTANVFRENIEG